jgi:hypothetical protein
MAASSTRRTTGGTAGFCCLAYCPTDLAAAQRSELQTIMVLVRHDRHGLKIFRHPSLWKIVIPEDHHYFSRLLDDLHLRARHEPDRLFQQMSNLGVGPLVTRKCGELATNGPGLPLDALHFIPHEPDQAVC